MIEEYPEHEKLKALNGKNIIIGDFIESLGKIDLCLCETNEYIREYEQELTPTRKDTQQILGEYFNIDQGKLEEEKQAMLEGLRK